MGLGLAQPWRHYDEPKHKGDRDCGTDYVCEGKLKTDETLRGDEKIGDAVESHKSCWEEGYPIFSSPTCEVNRNRPKGYSCKGLVKPCVVTPDN